MFHQREVFGLFSACQQEAALVVRFAYHPNKMSIILMFTYVFTGTFTRDQNSLGIVKNDEAPTLLKILKKPPL
jgi:hypothetical protein